ncbi:MAG: hypothetical protein VX112_04395 [Pseudomonadota bacterium]|nr:hypothetical protein [Pseudomonadota bacterium]
MADMNPTLAIKATTLKSNTKPASKSQNRITNPIPLWCYVVTTICATINGIQCAVFALDFMNSFTTLTVALTCAAASFICNMLTFMMGSSESLYTISKNYDQLLKKPNIWQSMVANISTCTLFFICGMNSWLNNFAIFGIPQTLFTLSATFFLSFCCALANLILLSSGLLQQTKPAQGKSVDTFSGKLLGNIVGPIQAVAFSFVLCMSSIHILSMTFPNPALQTTILASQIFLALCCMVSQYGFYKNRTIRVVSDNDFKDLTEKSTRPHAVLGFFMVTLNAVANAFMVASGNLIHKSLRLFVLAPVGMLASLIVNTRSLKEGLHLYRNFNNPSFEVERIKTWPKWQAENTTPHCEGCCQKDLDAHIDNEIEISKKQKVL